MQTDNLIRSRYDRGAAEMHADGDKRTLFGHFAVFDTWTAIESTYEGRFLERIAPGAFAEAFKDTRGLRVLFEHGRDPSIGNKPIGRPIVLREDDQGAYHESELFTDASYVRDLEPALEAEQLGASFRFGVPKGGDQWVKPRKATEQNPEKLEERTIHKVKLYEYGPVTWGAYPDASSGIRSGTDSFIDQLIHDPLFLARITERMGLPAVEQILTNVPEAVRADVVEQATDAAQQGTSGLHIRTAADIQAVTAAIYG
jgi:HK97 family phage prohead protease